ncbi:MAG: toll/interleukin-1 receptor domain-containing protein, partial [Streptomyces sp.]|nr:toll/interleukin-1 receptor domain-containing protein [Streptomyces sp.]
MSADQHPLVIEPVVAWPRQAETECDYLVTVDLRGPLPGPDGTPATWPYPVEEFTFTIALDGSPSFVCTALDEPSVVLHRFGGTYGAARFRVATTGETGPASLWLTISNQWGVPVRKAELPSEVRERAPGREPQARTSGGGPRLPEVRSPNASPTAGPEVSPGPGRSGGLVRGGSYEGAMALPRSQGADRRQAVTISFAGANRPWAAWIGDRLERRGVHVTPLRWDPSPRISLEEALHDLLLAPGRVLLVLSEWYFQLGPRTREEWNAALREVVSPDPSRFAAVSVTTSPVP